MKSITRTIAAGVALAALSAAGMAGAQDFNADPNYGTVRLTGGFTPDPYNVSVRSGGSIDISRRSSSCRGFISNAPDLRLHFNPGSLPLIISANSSADTTLVVNAPDGQWYCDDDSGAGTNPSVRFNSPLAGRYEIWIGTYGNSSLQPATLSISEVTSH